MSNAEVKELSHTYADALEHAADYIAKRNSPYAEAVCYALRHRAEFFRMPDVEAAQLVCLQNDLRRELSIARATNTRLVGLVNRALALAAVPERDQDGEWYAESEAIGRALLETESKIEA